ncbi:MAG: hypothetical protein ABW185_04095 [Sedimenticola sp.]
MSLQRDNCGFSVSMVSHSKARCAENGHSLVKHCNVAVGRHGNALWVSLSEPMGCVAPLAKGAAIAGEARLAMNADKLTESVIIMLKGH